MKKIKIIALSVLVIVISAFTLKASGMISQLKYTKLLTFGASNSDIPAVALCNNIAIIGNPDIDEKKGEAYIYTYDGNCWNRKVTLTAGDGKRNDLFGISVAIGTTDNKNYTILVGAPGSDSQKGTIYTYTYDGDTLVTFGACLSDFSLAYGDLFGSSLAISGDTAIIGAPGASNKTGTAYVYIPNQQLKPLNPYSSSLNGEFGRSISISGDTVIIGAPKDNIYGRAYIFTRENTIWSLKTTLNPEFQCNIEYGGAVSISKNFACVGSPGSLIFGKEIGDCIFYENVSSGWNYETNWSFVDYSESSRSGSALSSSDKYTVIGVPGYFNNSGGIMLGQYPNNFGQHLSFPDDLQPNDRFGSSVAVAYNDKHKTLFVLVGSIHAVYVSAVNILDS